MFTGGTFSVGELCMKRPSMPEGFINEDDIIGNKTTTLNTTHSTRKVTTTLSTNLNTTITNNVDFNSNTTLSTNLNTTNNVDSNSNTTITNNVESTKDTKTVIVEDVQKEETITEPLLENTVEEPKVEEVEKTIDKETLLSNPDWNTIVDIVRKNDGTFSVGDVFTSTIAYNSTTKKFPWIVADIRKIADSNDVEHNALILISKYACIQKLPFDNGSNNDYKYSIIRQYLNSENKDNNWFTLQYDGDVEYTPEIPTFQSTLPEDFVKVVKPIKIDSDCNDKFWIPSLEEMNVNYSNSSNNEPLQYFVNLSEDGNKVELGSINNNYKFKRANATSTAVTYWTRTSFVDDVNNSVYACFASNGTINSNIVTDSFAIVPVCAIY